MTVVSGIGGDQLSIAKRKTCGLENAGYDKTVSSCALDNIYFYTSPEADRERKKGQPKRRKVTTKASWSCFGCRLNKRKDILNKNAYRTPVQKFTCNVRTKFVDFAYSCFTDVPKVSDSARGMFTETVLLILNGTFGRMKFGFTFPTISDNMKRSQEAMVSMIYELVEHLRSFLDFMEPLHVRQFFSPYSHRSVLWSYSLSIIKWEKEIGSLWPSLEDDLYFHKSYHRHAMRPSFLYSLDQMKYLGGNFDVALSLNVWYEELLGMDKNPIMSSSAKDHLQSLLTDRILHIYRSILPSNTADKASRREELENRAMQLSLFHLTTGLLPSHYRHLPMGNVALGILRLQKTSTCSDENLPPEKADPHCQKPPGNSFPMLKAYVPAKLFVILGLDTEIQDSSTNSQWMEPIEVGIREYLKIHDANVQKEMLDFSPYTLSIGTKALFEEFNRFLAEKGLARQSRASWGSKGREMLLDIVKLSLRYCTILIVSVKFWSALQNKDVTLAEFVMENRELEDKCFRVLVDGSESSRARLISVLVSRVSTSSQSVHLLEEIQPIFRDWLAWFEDFCRPSRS
ncbi:hypothetical protein IG631_12934 [Alternaria alternata]|nr:hypothetical protein IG631_12934 [Alternaria alternata]